MVALLAFGMARISDVGFKRKNGETVIGQLSLSYVERLHRYAGIATLDGESRNFVRVSAVDALEAAREWLMGRGLKYVAEAPKRGPRAIRIIRSGGAALATDRERGIPLGPEVLDELVRCETPQALHAFLSAALLRRLEPPQQKILEQWLGDPRCFWGFLPADALKASSTEVDFTIDENVLWSLDG